jgi:prepilin-type N-terminal cleavage/methylation domain-containing protein
LDEEVIYHPANKVSARQAFTLIELLLVMTLLTVVFALSMPSLSRFFRGRALDAEARRLLSLVRYGQSRAASEGIPMELWVDTRQGTYGLEAEPAYLENDDKAREFTLAGDLTIEVPQATVTSLSASEQARQAKNAAASRRAALPKFRFLPDGAPDVGNPRYLRLLDGEGAALDIAPTRNRLSYEIGMATNNEVELSTRR